MYASSRPGPAKCKQTSTKLSALSLGLALPFHPSMQDEKTVGIILKDSEESVHAMLYEALEQAYAENMIIRLKKLFNKLNHSSHCKSIAVLITPHEERVTYLNFAVKPVTYLNKWVSLLELAANIDRQPDFYLLALEPGYSRLSEYYNEQLHQVYATKHEKGLNEKVSYTSSFKQVSQTIERLNGNNEKPVFITGTPNLVELFCNSVCDSGTFIRLLHNGAPNDDEVVRRLVKEIIGDWNYWHSKFVMDRIMLTKKTSVLIAETEIVLQALSNSVDGLLLIDKRLKLRLYKSRRATALFNSTDEFVSQVDRFLTRGNHLEITEAGLLKEFGEIVLLQYKPAHSFTFSPARTIGKYTGSDTF